MPSQDKLGKYTFIPADRVPENNQVMFVGLEMIADIRGHEIIISSSPQVRSCVKTRSLNVHKNC